MPKHTTFAVIGTGGLAQSQHLPNLARASHARLKTVCDLRESVVKAVQEKYDVPHACTDHREVLADPEIEAVVIATREDTHVPLTVEALNAGKHVYVEKPLAETPAECDRVVAAQKASGKHVAVGFNRRFAPAYVRAKEIAEAHGGARNLYYRISDAYWMWGAHFAPGSRVFHEVCHIFDILRYLTGSEPVSIYTVQSRPDDELFTLQFANGAVATIMSSGYAQIDLPKEYLELVVEDKGVLTVTDFVELRAFGLPDCEPVTRFAGHIHPDRDHLHRYLLAKEGAQALMDIRRVAFENYARLEVLRREGAQTPERAELEAYWSKHAPLTNYLVDKGWLQAVDHFAECIATGTVPRNASAFDGLRAAEVTAAAIESRGKGTVVRIG